MIQLLLIYYLGKAHYQNALNHHKSKWTYAFLSFVVYLLGMIVGLTLLGLVLWSAFDLDMLRWPSYTLDLMGIPMGGLTSWWFLKYLKNLWSADHCNTDILDEFD